MEMRRYVAERTAVLLGRLVFQATRVAKSPDPDAVHDFRVAIRRFAQCLRVFAVFFPVTESKRVRRRLRRILRLAAEVRNRDMALQLSIQAGMPSDAIPAARLEQERGQAQQELVQRLLRLRKRDFSRKWRKRLKL